MAERQAIKFGAFIYDFSKMLTLEDNRKGQEPRYQTKRYRDRSPIEKAYKYECELNGDEDMTGEGSESDVMECTIWTGEAGGEPYETKCQQTNYRIERPIEYPPGMKRGTRDSHQSRVGRKEDLMENQSTAITQTKSSRGAKCVQNYQRNYLKQTHPNKQTPLSSVEKILAPIQVVEKSVSSGKDLFSLMDTCAIADKSGCRFLMVEYSWRRRHLKLVQGLNILSTCKNYECGKFLEGVICPRGAFPERKGYCPLDGEIFNAICPKCKQHIYPDESMGFGFYNCGFQLNYKILQEQEVKTEFLVKNKAFYFGKFKPGNQKFVYLEVRIKV